MSDNTQRIDAFLAGNGFCARRKVGEFLLKHKVTQNGKKITASGHRINLDEDVYVDAHVVKPVRYYYFALHKPIRYLCSSSDHEGRKLALDLIPLAKNVRLYNVGRLDYFSEGLIFFTNDGDFTKKLTHPSFEVEKEYEVTLERRLTETEVKRISKGLLIEDVHYDVVSLRHLKNATYSLVLHEGKNREIRRIFAFFGIKILRLKRERIGAVSLNNLPLGEYRALTLEEITSFVD